MLLYSKIIPQFIGVSCGNPPDVANATWTENGLRFEDIASYSCEPGFEVSDGVTTWNVTCESTAMWSVGSTCTSKYLYDNQISFNSKPIQLTHMEIQNFYY